LKKIFHLEDGLFLKDAIGAVVAC